MTRETAPQPGVLDRAFPAILAGIAIVTVLLVVLATSFRHEPSRFFVHTDQLRRIVGLVRGAALSYPMKDGTFDPYEFARRGDIRRGEYDVFRSERMGMGPTDEEIERGDYTNFPWERRQGEFAEGVLLLWEKVPDKHGGRLVAFSDGSAVYLDAEQFDAVLRRER